MRGLVALLAVMAALVALPVLAQNVQTIIIEDPMQAFLFRAYELYKYLRMTVIGLSVYYFVVFAWKAFMGEGESGAKSLFTTCALLITLGAAELTVAYFLTREGDIMVEDFEENIRRVVGDAKLDAPEGIEVDAVSSAASASKPEPAPRPPPRGTVTARAREQSAAAKPAPAEIRRSPVPLPPQRQERLRPKPVTPAPAAPAVKSAAPAAAKSASTAAASGRAAAQAIVKMPRSQRKTDTAFKGRGEISVPLGRHAVTDRFEMRWSPNAKTNLFHMGVDLGVRDGNYDLTWKWGEGEFVGRAGGNNDDHGNYAVFKTPSGHYMVFAHLDPRTIANWKVGDKISTGQKIGRLATKKEEIGRGSTGPHLHWEIMDPRTKTWYNPLTFGDKWK